jgi:hypothetical protein
MGRYARGYACLLGLAALASSALAQPALIFWGQKAQKNLSNWAWFRANVTDHIKVSGYRDLGLHFDKVSGDLDAYNVTTYYGQGNRTFTDIGNLSVTGKDVLGLFNFDFQFADSRFQDPLASHLSLDYDKRGLRIDAGDINATIASGNRFTTFSRQLYGLFGSYAIGRTNFSLLESASKSTSQTISFTGNNSTGPYYLQNSQILPSISVEVDGKAYVLGTDFDLDQVQGSITFRTLVVPPTSTITVSFQSVGLNSGGGELQAATLGYNLGRFGSLYVSGARQTDPFGGGLTTFTDRFQGYGDATIPYQLQYVPLNQSSVVVRVDGIIQVVGVDYYFSPSNPTILFFNRAVPQTSTLTVTYTPQPTNSTHGDRTVLGIAYGLPIGPKGRDGNLSYSEALGRLYNDATPLHGLARALDFQYKYKTYKLTASADDVPTGFVGINTTGFQRNEVSQTATLEDRRKNFSYGVTESNAAVANRNVDSLGNITFTNARSTTLGGFMTYGENAGGLWRLDQSHLAGFSTSGTTRADQTSLTYSRRFRSFEPRLVLSRTEGLGPITDATGNTTQNHIRLESIGLGGTYEASKNWILGAQTTFDDIKTDTSSGRGNDVNFNAAYRGLKKVVWTALYAYSNSGSLASLGQFQNGSGFGYNGNGFSEGVPNNTSTNTFNTSASNSRRLSTNILWTPSEATTINFTLASTGQSGEITSNSNSTNALLSGDFKLTQRSNLDVSVTRYNSTFADTTTSSTGTTLLSVGYDNAPRGPWSYRVGVSDLLSEGGAQSQDSLNLNFDLRHRLRKNQILGLELILGRISKYLPQDQDTVRASYTYRLFKTMDLIAAYNIRGVVNKDPTVTSGNYQSRGLDFELRFNFAG